jgi:hypothetical protein
MNNLRKEPFTKDISEFYNKFYVFKFKVLNLFTSYILDVLNITRKIKGRDIFDEAVGIGL